MQRRIRLGDGPAFDPDQVHAERANRARTARRLRTALRRGDPVLLATPRWGGGRRLLEGIALELAVERTPVRCRTVSFRPLQGRREPEAWRFLVGLFLELASRGRSRAPAPLVASRSGFHAVLVDCLARWQERVTHRSALLVHGAEHTPLGALHTVVEAFNQAAEELGPDRRIDLVLASAAGMPPVPLAGAMRFEAEDLGRHEALVTLTDRSELPVGRALASAAHFSGGVPEIVEALAAGARRLGGFPQSAAGLLRCLGGLRDELRGALRIALADTRLAERLDHVMAGLDLDPDPRLDEPLLLAGLVRRRRAPGGPHLVLRAPIFAALDA